MLLIAHDHARLCDFLRDSSVLSKNHATFHDHCSLITISTVKRKMKWNVRRCWEITCSHFSFPLLFALFFVVGCICSGGRRRLRLWRLLNDLILRLFRDWGLCFIVGDYCIISFVVAEMSNRSHVAFGGQLFGLKSKRQAIISSFVGLLE